MAINIRNSFTRGKGDVSDTGLPRVNMLAFMHDRN